MARRTLPPHAAGAARGDRRHHAVLLSDLLWVGDRAGVSGARRSRPARALSRIDHGVVSRPAGARAQGTEHPRSQPALQCAACQRLRRQGALLDLPRPRGQRPQCAAAAVGTGGLCAGARRRRRQPVDPARLPAPAADRCRHHSGAARQCRRRFRPQPQPRQYRRGALYRQHVRRYARIDAGWRKRACPSISCS